MPALNPSTLSPSTVRVAALFVLLQSVACGDDTTLRDAGTDSFMADVMGDDSGLVDGGPTDSGEDSRLSDTGDLSDAGDAAPDAGPLGADYVYEVVCAERATTHCAASLRAATTSTPKTSRPAKWRGPACAGIRCRMRFTPWGPDYSYAWRAAKHAFVGPIAAMTSLSAEPRMTARGSSSLWWRSEKVATRLLATRRQIAPKVTATLKTLVPARALRGEPKGTPVQGTFRRSTSSALRTNSVRTPSA